ncbi:hypothetical protein [Siphonobacter sp. SORGH_AS_0500]|uniref:hypothetical protein n=1 Tax=Siphonobacter sp. SORGH_AS_0500 TaxID=1864824 RepID=UPI002861C305|nr:hypothetical protein [Siphonobacter sp. SORGH_AS_0500]MDR6194929.1 hypothetical protein [Siphonobacter sp. SORGH_AS_0500]
MTRKAKEGAIKSYLSGDTGPLKQLMQTSKAGLYILATHTPEDEFTDIVVQSKEGTKESHPHLTRPAFESMIKRLEKSHHLLIIY